MGLKDGEKRALEILFKLSWILAVLFTLCFMFWMLFLNLEFNIFGSNDSADNESFHFPIATLFSIFLILRYSKELLVGYFPNSEFENKFTLIIIFMPKI